MYRIRKRVSLRRDPAKTRVAARRDYATMECLIKFGVDTWKRYTSTGAAELCVCVGATWKVIEPSKYPEAFKKALLK